MVDYSEIRHSSPSIAFLFARLGALIDSSSDPLGALSYCSNNQYPQIGDFVISDSGLGLVLGDLYPLLYQSLTWFKSVCGVLRREIIGSEVRSSDLERGSSSGVGTARAGTDIATSMPSSTPSSSHPSVFATSRPFHALKEKCTLKADIFSRFRDRFQFPAEIRVHLPRKGEKACAFAHGEVCFMRLRSRATPDFPSIHSLWSFFTA